ncbi:MAG: hypothetical protein AAGD11_18590 [Planctomycetota bacterium]
MFGGLPGGSGKPGEVTSWMVVLIVALVAALLAGGLFWLLTDAVVEIENTQPNSTLSF